MDKTDRTLINLLQKGIPVCDRPYEQVSHALGITEEEVLTRLGRLLDDRVLTRFGPMYNAERLGGGLTLAAMAVSEDDFDRVAAIVNAFPEVAHNYARDHRLNMWFVLATETQDDIAAVITRIEQETGLTVLNLPKQEEFHVGLYLPV